MSSDARCIARSISTWRETLIGTIRIETPDGEVYEDRSDHPTAEVALFIAQMLLILAAAVLSIALLVTALSR
jgi:hypothetical protein